MSEWPQAVNDRAKELYAHQLANGTLKKRAGLVAIRGRASRIAGEVTWVDYLPEARAEFLRKRR